MSAQDQTERKRSVRIAVLGAGMSGLCTGVQLKRRGVDDFVILEKAETVGGTWRENTYPGVACDVPSHVYSFSFELNPDWSHSYSSGGEIRTYCEGVAEKYDLERHTCFGTEVKRVHFDGHRWQIETSTGPDVEAEVVVSGLGGLHLPRRAEIEGIEGFSGARFHSAQWDHDVELEGKKVAIVGTGASAAQILPAIAGRVAEVTVFQRSAAWVFPRLARDIPNSRRALFRRVPLLMRLYRWFLWSLMDLMGMLSLERGGFLAGRLQKMGIDHIAESVEDPDLRKQLTPDYLPGCKRRVISDDYLSSFNRDNVHLVTDAIERVEPAGIRDEHGVLHECDVLVEATGFRPFDISDYVEVEGRGGLRLRDVWRSEIETLRTMMVPGFPNFFMMLGPNSATGHTSALIMIESTVQYVMKCLDMMEREEIPLLDPDPEVVRAYNRRLQRDMKRMVFSGGCNAWYTDENDRNFTLWPYSAARFILEQLRVKPSEFQKSR